MFNMMEANRNNLMETPPTAFLDHSTAPSYGKTITALTFYTTNFTTPANIVPGISSSTHLSLTIVFMTLYALLFLMILVQLCLILYFKHRRLSYQSVFLFIYLFWAALRTTLFSFYFNDTTQANSFVLFARWLLYALPIYLQFLTLSLLTLYLAKVSTHLIHLCCRNYVLWISHLLVYSACFRFLLNLRVVTAAVFQFALMYSSEHSIQLTYN